MYYTTFYPLAPVMGYGIISSFLRREGASTWRNTNDETERKNIMKTLKGFILAATFAVAPLLLIADSELYDIQFEVDGSTYVLSN